MSNSTKSLLNRSSNKPTTTPEEEMLKRTIALIVGLTVAILNSIQMVILVRKKKKKTIYEKCLLSLSVADMFFGLSNVIVAAIYLAEKQELIIVYDITYAIFFFCVTTSILHVLWIALDRLWAVIFPFNHNVMVTGKRIHILLAITWIVTLLISVTIFFSIQSMKSLQSSNKDNSATVTTRNHQCTKRIYSNN